MSPALLYKLAWDSEAFTEFYKLIVERNGGRTISSLLAPLTGIDLNQLRSESGISVWKGILDENNGVIALRNRVVHRGDKASLEEAQSSLTLVKDFMRLTRSFFEEAVERISRSMKRVSLENGNPES